MASRVGCLDACCRGARSADEFQNASGNGLEDRDVVELVKMSLIGVVVIIIFHAFIHSLWSLATIVPGFNLFDGTAGTYSAYTHTGWWLMIDYVVSAMGIASVLFGLNYAAEVGVLELGAERMITWLQSYMIVLAFGIVAHLIHVGFTLSEISNCTSTLCVQQYWCLVVLIVVLFVSVFLLGWLIVRVYAFMNNLKLAMAFGRVNMTLMTFATHDEEKPTPDVPATTTVTNTTPLITPQGAGARVGRSAALDGARALRASSLLLDPHRNQRKQK